MKIERISPEQAAPLLDMHPDDIRKSLREGTLPIGHARRANKGPGYRYDIYKHLVLRYVGLEESEVTI